MVSDGLRETAGARLRAALGRSPAAAGADGARLDALAQVPCQRCSCPALLLRSLTCFFKGTEHRRLEPRIVLLHELLQFVSTGRLMHATCTWGATLRLCLLSASSCCIGGVDTKRGF